MQRNAHISLVVKSTKDELKEEEEEREENQLAEVGEQLFPSLPMKNRDEWR